MPRALAIETSGRSGSVALAQDGRMLVEERFPHGLKHAAELVPTIDRLCRGAGWRPADLDEIYLSAGPGSFTGLRVGVTVAKTLAFAIGAKVVAVPSGRVIANNAPNEARSVVIVLDAKRDQIFTARYQRAEDDHDWREAEPPHLDSLQSMLERSGRPVWLIGEGIPHHQKFIASIESGIIVADEPLWPGQAREVLRIGEQMARRGEFIDANALNPIYLRKPEAEEKRDALENGSR